MTDSTASTLSSTSAPALSPQLQLQPQQPQNLQGREVEVILNSDYRANNPVLDLKDLFARYADHIEAKANVTLYNIACIASTVADLALTYYALQLPTKSSKQLGLIPVLVTLAIAAIYFRICAVKQTKEFNLSRELTSLAAEMQRKLLIYTVAPGELTRKQI